MRKRRQFQVEEEPHRPLHVPAREDERTPQEVHAAVFPHSLADERLAYPANAEQRATLLLSSQRGIGNAATRQLLEESNLLPATGQATPQLGPTCRAYPHHCPFGGACHSCPVQGASLPARTAGMLEREGDDEGVRIEKPKTQEELNETKKRLGVEQATVLVEKAIKVLEDLAGDRPLLQQQSAFVEQFEEFNQENVQDVKKIFDHIKSTLPTKVWEFTAGTCDEEPGQEVKCASATIGQNRIIARPCFGTRACPVGVTTVHEAAHNAGAKDHGAPLKDAYAIERFALAAKDLRVKPRSEETKKSKETEK